MSVFCQMTPSGPWWKSRLWCLLAPCDSVGIGWDRALEAAAFTKYMGTFRLLVYKFFWGTKNLITQIFKKIPWNIYKYNNSIMYKSTNIIDYNRIYIYTYLYKPIIHTFFFAECYMCMRNPIIFFRRDPRFGRWKYHQKVPRELTFEMFRVCLSEMNGFDVLTVCLCMLMICIWYEMIWFDMVWYGMIEELPAPVHR